MRLVGAAVLCVLVLACPPQRAPVGEEPHDELVPICGDAGVPCCADVMPQLLAGEQADLPLPLPLFRNLADAGWGAFLDETGTWLSPARLPVPVTQPCASPDAGPCVADSVLRLSLADGGVLEILATIGLEDLLRFDAGAPAEVFAIPADPASGGPLLTPVQRRLLITSGRRSLQLWTSFTSSRFGDQDDGGRLPPFYLGGYTVRRSAEPLCRIQHRGCVFDAYAFDLGEGRLLAPGMSHYANPDGGSWPRFTARAALRLVPALTRSCTAPIYGPDIYSFEVYDE